MGTLTFPLATLAPTVSNTGISPVALENILQSFVASMQGIFGSDIYLDTDSQDYQLLAVVGQAVYDTGMALVGVYNSFSPATAVGTGLSSVVKINGIARLIGSNSQAIVQITGTAGTTVSNGVVEDEAGNRWDLPASFVIPPSGLILVTATAETTGSITALPGTIDKKYNPQLGWQTATNPSAATVGAPVETDAQLRQRQAISTARPSRTSLVAISGAVAEIAGVTRSKVYENDTNATDVNGVPAHSISPVIAGGDATAIAQAVELYKDAGCGTYGSTTVVVNDPGGLPIPIQFFPLNEMQTYASITIQPRAGYVDSTGDAIIAAAVAYINALDIGEDVYQPWVLAAASLIGTSMQQTFVITALTIGFAANNLAGASLTVPFNAAAISQTANVTLVVPSA